MKLHDIFEGMMKRSDPWISGDKSGPRPTHSTVGSVKQKGTSHSQRLADFAKKGNVSPDRAAQIWDEERDKVDSKHPQRWAIVTKNVKRRLNLSESIDNDPGAPPAKTVKTKKLGEMFRGGKQDLDDLFKKYGGVYFTDDHSTASAYGPTTFYNLDELGFLKVFDYWKDEEYTYKLAESTYGRTRSHPKNFDVMDWAASAFITSHKTMRDILTKYGIQAVQLNDMILVLSPEVVKLKPISKE